MAIYALSDFHLSLSMKEKPMDIFGMQWENHMEQIQEKCNEILKEEDILLIPGDISWATYLEEAREDLEFIHRLPGKKIISKGNHDYWWNSHKKLKEFSEACGFNSLHFLHNNFFFDEEVAICGNKGYFYTINENSSSQDKKLHDRELIRLELSLEAAHQAGFFRKIVMTHFPPSRTGKEPEKKIMELFEKYHVIACVYGHLHGRAQQNLFEGHYGETEFSFVSCEYRKFEPKLIYDKKG